MKMYCISHGFCVKTIHQPQERMKTEIDYNTLSEGGKSFLLSQAENGLRPSEAIIRNIEQEARRRGFIVHLTTANKTPQPRKSNPEPKKPAA